MVLLPACICCPSTCLGPDHPDFLEFDLSVSTDLGAAVFETEDFASYPADQLVWLDSKVTHTISPSPAQTVTVRLPKLVPDSNGFMLYTYAGQERTGYTIQAGVRRVFTRTPQPLSPGELVTTVRIRIDATYAVVDSVSSRKEVDYFDYGSNKWVYKTTSSTRTTPVSGNMAWGFDCVSAIQYDTSAESVSYRALGLGGTTNGLKNVIVDPGNLPFNRLSSKVYAGCNDAVGVDYTWYATEGTFFPVRAQSSECFGVNTFFSEYYTEFGSRYNRLAGTLKSSSGLAAVPAGYGTPTVSYRFFNQHTVTISLLGMRYGFGADPGASVIPSGFARADMVNSPLSGCPQGYPGLWTFDY